MRRLVLLLGSWIGLATSLTVLAAAGLGLSACHDDGGGAGGARGGGSGGGQTSTGGGSGAFRITVLDADARVDTYLAMAFDPVTERVGVAYFTPRGTATSAPADGGTSSSDDFNLKYVEYRQGVISPPQTIRYMQRMVGLALAFDPSTQEPVVAYLGGASGFVQGQSIYWFQHEAAYARRSGGTTWTETVVARDSGDAPAGNNVSDMGFLVGLWPSILFDASGRFSFVYRDGHQGQFPLQDWGASDVELWSGTLGGALTGSVLAAGGKDKKGYGGHLQLVLGASQPAVFYDEMPATPDGPGQLVWFSERGQNGSWTTPQIVYNVSNTGAGAAVAFDHADGTDGGTIEGFGVAVGAGSYLKYLNRDPRTGLWSTADSVFTTGSGGWYPSLAMDPIHHEPAIAFYVCAARSGVNEAQCLDRENELRVTQRVEGNWQELLVDEEGGYAPKLGFFASGKRFVVYRTPEAVSGTTGQPVGTPGIVKIAVEP